MYVFYIYIYDDIRGFIAITAFIQVLACMDAQPLVQYMAVICARRYYLFRKLSPVLV